MSPAERKSLLHRLAAALDRRPEVLEAYLFGSIARGESRPHSDIDVALYLDPSSFEDGEPGGDVPDRGGKLPSLAARAAEIGADLGAAVGSNAIDIVALNAASPLLYHRVLRDGIRLISRDLEATTRRAGQALSRYCDYLPQLAKIDAAHHRRIAAGEFGR